MALASGKCQAYCGVELFDRAAAIASQTLTQVVVGDVEKVELPWKPTSFDALIMSEVLEHLVDPWAALRRLRPLLKPGAMVFASSPNASHYEVILMLLRGDWRC
jgi:2-polyprenyl-3-methyl-5-hydroxy-6-metoxy-1,4-benzoquinol methylase